MIDMRASLRQCAPAVFPRTQPAAGIIGLRRRPSVAIESPACCTILRKRPLKGERHVKRTQSRSSATKNAANGPGYRVTYLQCRSTGARLRRKTADACISLRALSRAEPTSSDKIRSEQRRNAGLNRLVHLAREPARWGSRRRRGRGGNVDCA